MQTETLFYIGQVDNRPDLIIEVTRLPTTTKVNARLIGMCGETLKTSNFSFGTDAFAAKIIRDCEAHFKAIIYAE